MTESLDDLRRQLRELGYLTHRLERWFALDPWSSRTFWQELLLVAAKGATLVSLFAALPMIAAMLSRNGPLPLGETLALAAAYLVLWLAAVFVLLLAAAAALELRPAAGIERPSLLTGLALALALVIAACIGVWWVGFDGEPGAIERVAVPALILLLIVVGTVVFSAALLSFSIHETGRIPAVARRSRSLPILLAGGAMLVAIVAASSGPSGQPAPEPPAQIVVEPTEVRLALVAVDGLTRELLLARPGLRESFATEVPLAFPRDESAAGRWASVGTGTPSDLHRVSSVEGIRIGAEGRVLQQVSRFDPLRSPLAGWTRLVRRQPLPSSIRDRHYVWEILAARGIPAVAVNWWVSRGEDEGALRSIGQDALFAAAAGEDAAERAVDLDRRAIEALRSALAERPPRFATVYLPALDIVINRLDAGEGRSIPLSLEALDRIAALVADLRSSGYEVMVIGAPGDRQQGSGVLVSMLPFDRREAEASDLAPTLLELFGFPASSEMDGRPLLGTGSRPRISTYGSRTRAEEPDARDQEYYEALRSLGYVR
ncbi:MAG TPA: hypothetical protein VMS56_02445 [Thermoanaerobaculia bacterium]|nr:hypothetical protein [Thermoanaerobaculia bacterium]